MAKKPVFENVVQRLLATQDADQIQIGEGRTISYVFSDESIARDGHTIRTDGWVLDNFKANPVFLWCHDSTMPPIGRVTNIAVQGKRLVGTVEYADAETYEFADTIYRLTKGGYLNAVSVSWQPLKWQWSKDKSRPNGIDFESQELLEVSSVPVPALPTALATARSAGIDTKPLYDWAEKILDSGDKILVPRDELELLRREAKPPTATVKIEEVPMPEKRDIGKAKIGKRGLYQVGWLANLLSELGYLSDNVDYEAAIEEDNSAVPAALVDALKALGQVLIDMTIEEVAEMLADNDDETNSEIRLAAFAKLRKLDTVALMISGDVAQMHMDGKNVTFTHSMALGPQGFARAGKALSAKNTSDLEAIHKCCDETTSMVRDFIDSNTEDDASDVEIDEDGDRKVADAAKRVRLAAAARAKHAFETAN